MRTYFSIGEVSRITGFSINALRHYDKIGLCKPIVVNPQSNYRYYHEKQLFLFDVIRFAKNIHMPLEKLKEIFDQQDMESFKDFLQTVREQMSDQIDQLRNNILDLDIIQNQIAVADILIETRDVYRRDIEERTVVTTPVLSEKINNYYIKQLENLEQQIIDNGLTPMFESGIIYHGQAQGNLVPLALYKTISLDFNADADSLTTFPGGTYLCINYDPAHREEAYQIMQEEIDELNLKNPAIIDTQLLNDIFHENAAYREIQVFIGDYQ